MDGWGSLTMLIKRQQAAKNRKSELRFQLQKRKESFLSSKNINEFEFPAISNSEMKTLKQQIRKDLKKERIKNLIINLILLLCSIAFIYYLTTSLNF